MRAPVNCKRSFELFHERVEFCSNRASILDDLIWLYSSFVTDIEPTYTLNVTHKSNRFAVVTPHDSKEFDTYWKALLFGIKARLLNLFWNEDTRPIAFHAASVCRDGGGLLLVGPDRVGKTTLALALRTYDFDVYSDEFGILDRKNLTLWPYPAPVAIRNQTSAILGIQGKIRPHLFEQNIWDPKRQDEIKYLIPLPISYQPKPCKLAHIVVLNETANQPMEVSSLAPADFIRMLLRKPHKPGEFYIHKDLGGETGRSSIMELESAIGSVGVSQVRRGSIDRMTQLLIRIHEQTGPGVNTLQSFGHPQ